MLSLPLTSLSFTGNVAPTGVRRAPAATMKESVSIVLADKEVEAKVMAVVNVPLT